MTRSFTPNAPNKTLMTIPIRSLLFLEKQRIELYEDDGFIPAFQRDLVWTLEQKQNLILSILDNIPIGIFYTNRVNMLDRDGNGLNTMRNLDTILYDGQQRFTAIKEFLAGEFPIPYNSESLYVHDFDKSLKNHILQSLVQVAETSFENYEELVNYYIKINCGGTFHTQEDIQKALDALANKEAEGT